MESETILKQFKEKVSEKITLKEKGVGRYLVQTPFIFEDGDNLVIILKYDKEIKKWKLTDEAHTFMHLSYSMEMKDISQGTRREIIQNSETMFGVKEKSGELFLYIENENFGNALFDFIQTLLKIIDISFIGRERVKSAFFEDFKISITKIVKKKKLSVEFDYHVDKDKKEMYPIDACITSKQEKFFIFAINSDAKCMNAMISLLMLERWNLKFHSIGIFENQEDIAGKILAKFSDVAEKSISSLDQIERFEKFIENH